MKEDSEDKNPVGRPLAFKTPEELQEAISSYFEACDSSEIKVYHKQLTKSGELVEVPIRRPYTVEGLAEHLGVSRMTLINYKGRPEFFYTITQAIEKITRHKIELALVGAYDSRFAVFDLINNSNYRNEKHIDHKTGGERITSVIIE